MRWLLYGLTAILCGATGFFAVTQWGLVGLGPALLVSLCAGLVVGRLS